ncbi:MAG TPA: glycosyl hydrolase family 28 protein [Puia sp.]|nr:glycosyl hydrolase family 28 protein [Puia sp.]
MKNFGAKADGHAIDTKAIQQAVDSCSASGGGIVYFPPGIYRSATIFLKNNVTLEIPAGSTVTGSTDIKDYPVITPSISYYSSESVHFSLFYAEGAKNICIRGNGLIDGRGAAFRDHSSLFPSNFTARPFVFWFVLDSNVNIKNISMQNSGYWMQHYLACENVLIEGIRVFNHSNKNNDMLDIDGCKNVRILHCIGDSDDDGITLKSMNERPDENILISDCILSSHCNAIKCGTESSGGFKNIIITNCIIKPSAVSDHTIYGNPAGNSGITLAAVDGGDLNGIVINNVMISGPLVPIFFRLGNRARPYKPGQKEIPVSHFTNVMVSHIIVEGASKWGCLIAGLPGHEIKNVQLSDISINFSGGGTLQESRKKFPEYEKNYPDAEQFGITNAYGFHIRHASNITMRNITMQYQGHEERPPIVLEDADNVELSGINAKISAVSDGYIKAINCGKLRISDCSASAEGKPEVFLKCEGDASPDIFLYGNDFRNFVKPVDAAHAVIHKYANAE